MHELIFFVELHQLHNHPTVPMPFVPIVRTADGEANCECYRLSIEMPCLYRDGMEGQFIKVNYQIHSRQAITIIGPTR